MRYTYVKGPFPGNNPIANALVIVAGVIVIGLALVLGFFAFLALSALVLVSAAVIGIRVWWLKRKLARNPPPGPGRGETTEVIEGEFQIVRGERERP